MNPINVCPRLPARDRANPCNAKDVSSCKYVVKHKRSFIINTNLIKEILMFISMRSMLKAVAALSILGFAAVANAGDFKANLVACKANGTTIGDVGSCGKIWKLKSGHARLGANGKLKVVVKGLVLNDTSVGKFNGTPDGVDAVAAAVICHGASGAAVAAQTDAMPLSQKGNAKVEAKVSLPNGCVRPVIVLRERYEGKIGGWLAGTGM